MSKSFVVFLSSLKMALATTMSRILGLVREQVMAAQFGASGVTDAFLIAYRIPNLLRDLFAEGAFSSAFVPTFVEVNAKDGKSARNLLWSLFILLFLITGSLSLLICIFAPELIGVFAPSFKSDPEKLELTVTLTRFMSPFLLFVSIAALFMGVLNSLKVFFLPSFAPVFFNISMIACMLLLPGFLVSKGYPAVLSLGVGVFVGGFIQALVQFPLIIKKGYGPILPKKIISQESKKVVKLLGPGLVGFAATQLNLIVNTILASGAAIGAVSWLSYGFRLFQLPVGILSVSIGNSNLVHFSSAWKSGDKEKSKELFCSSYFLSYLLILPAMIILLALNEEIINIIFERGLFLRESTVMTAKALHWYAWGLPFYGIYKICVPTFYTMDKHKVPIYTSVVCVLINILFCLYFVNIYGFEVLALGTTLSMLLNSSIQIFFTNKTLGISFTDIVNLRWLKLILSSVISYVVIHFFQQKIDFFQYSLIERCLFVFVQICIIVISYFLSVYLLGEREVVKIAINKMRRR